MHDLNLLTSITNYIISLSFLFIGLLVLIRKKPIIFSDRWFAYLLALMSLETIIAGFSYPIEMTTMIFPIFMLVFLYYFYFISKRVIIIGADGDDFKTAFISVLTEGNYKFEQTFTSIKIAEPILEISIAFQSWTGSGQIRMRNKENKETFEIIIAQLKIKEIKTNLIIPIVFMVIGGLFLAMEVSLLID